MSKLFLSVCFRLVFYLDEILCFYPQQGKGQALALSWALALGREGRREALVKSTLYPSGQYPHLGPHPDTPGLKPLTIRLLIQDKYQSRMWFCKGTNEVTPGKVNVLEIQIWSLFCVIHFVSNRHKRYVFKIWFKIKPLNNQQNEKYRRHYTCMENILLTSDCFNYRFVAQTLAPLTDLFGLK